MLNCLKVAILESPRKRKS